MTRATRTARTIWAADWVLPVSSSPVRNGAVVVEDGRVVAVLPAAEAGPADRHWSGCVLAPGLVNAHAHLEYGVGFADLATSVLPFPQWIRELTRRRIAADTALWAEQAADGVRRLLAGGTTCVADVVTHGPAIATVHAAGLAGVSYVEAVGADDRRWPAERERVVALLDAAPADATVGVSPHTLYTLGTAVFRAVLDLARERGLRLHTHLAETVEETEFVLAGSGPLAETSRRWQAGFELLTGGGAGVSPAVHLDSLGGLGPDVHVAHGVQLSAADRALLRERGSVVALCARSNAVLGAGEPPVAALLAEGSRVAVGTDSLASSPSLDLLEELRALRVLALLQGAPEGDLDQRLVEAATMGGAAAIGRDDVGQLRAGGRADLAVFRCDAGSSPYQALVSSGRCVATLLAGRLVHESVPA